MKIQLLTDYYPPFLWEFYKKHPEFETLSFEKMLELVLEQFHADTGAAYFHLKKHGYEASLMIVNCEPLQKKWAEENGIAYKNENWEKEIAFAQVKAFKPDVFYIESVFGYFGEFLKAIKPFCKMVVSWISTPFNENLDLSNIDLIVSSTPKFVEVFRQRGISSEYMLPAFDKRVLKKINNPQPKTIPFSFIGGLGTAHIKRKTALDFLVEKTPIQIWGYGYKQKYPIKSVAYFRNLLAPKNANLLKAYRGELWGLNMYDVLQKSLITFNIHEALLEGNVGNMRMFEASGVGTMILNDHGHNVAQLFEVGKEIETYRSLDEAVEKLNYFQANPEKAIEIGKQAQKRTLECYNYDVFVKNISSHIQKHQR